jgi:tetratricopeptide (TPR) repeat protein
MVIATLPLGLRTALESGNAVLFVGAGIGAHVANPSGAPAPDAAGLAKELASRFGIDAGAAPDLAKVSQIVELRKGRAELQTFLTKRLADLEPDETLKWLFSRRWAAIFTTNYDRVIERAYELIAEPSQIPVPISATSALIDTDPRFEVPIYHVHGSLFHGDSPGVLITESDYATFRERRRMLFEVLKLHFATAGFLYIGYSMKDPNWRILQEEIRAEFYPATPPRSYKISRATDPLDAEILGSMNIEPFDCQIGDFVALAQASLPDVAADGDRLRQLESSVPTDLGPAFQMNPAATARLLTSWEYVNAAPFNDQPNVGGFLSGDLPNWGLVGADLAFERDVESELLDDLLDFATSDSKRPTTNLVLGSAGYGISTVLLRLAARLVKEDAGPIFMHRRATPLTEGDLEFAASLGLERPFFIVDNAADVAPSVIGGIRHLRDAGMPACFLLGERTNEWRQSSRRLSAHEYALDALSDLEIQRLLTLLESQDALGVLKDLDPGLRFAAIKEKHEKQLLVAMREATEGRGFDAIIEDEYRGIQDEFCRLLYSAVCCFYRLRLLPRVEVVSEMLDCSVVEMYEGLTPALDGVVIWNRIDETRGIDVARARHHSIAEIVWERVVDEAEKTQMTLAGMGALNLAHHVDAKAFEAFVRNDRSVDAIGSFESKLRFFETAMRKDPHNAYVLQHYARMLLREEKPELALAQIERAIEMNPTLRVLRHTKGIILRHIALTAESAEIARRRLAQSEQSFRESFGPGRRDSYTYQAIAELYLGWAKRAGGSEAIDYIGKAEETIGEGLKVVPPNERDGLWIVSSAIQRYVGDTPGTLVALERAVRENPATIVGRYLLGMAYRSAGEAGKAVDVLRPVMEQHPNEFRAAVAYALALERLGEPYPKPVAVLRLSTLYGLRDARFVATLGGMLTMAGEYTEAERVFQGAREAGFGRDEVGSIEYVPRHGGGSAPRLEGRIISVRPGYAFIQVPGYLDFFLPGRRIGARQLARGMRISFTPGFSVRGGEATNVTYPGD